MKYPFLIWQPNAAENIIKHLRRKNLIYLTNWLYQCSSGAPTSFKEVYKVTKLIAKETNVETKLKIEIMGFWITLKTFKP